MDICAHATTSVRPGTIRGLARGVGLVALLAVTGAAQAALNDLGNGLVNDTTQDITWLKDANLVKTSCDANNALWQAFDPSSVTDNSGRTKAQICGDNGELNWYEAEAWIDVLNAQNYLGHSDWRQPATAQPDDTCSDTDTNGQDSGYRCEGSELGHLFNVTLGNPNDLDDGCYNPPATDPDHCLQNKGPFDHFQSPAYWSGTEYAPVPAAAWDFSTVNGFQGYYSKDLYSDAYVWPVRSGQSAAASGAHSVPALGLWGLGLMALLLAGLAWRRLE